MMNTKKILILIFITFCITTQAKQREFVQLSQLDSLINLTKNIDFNSIVFNRDSIAKYNYDGYIGPLRSYLYPNNTGLTDEELFNKYKLYQKYLKLGGKNEINKPYKIAMIGEFRRKLGENPYDYMAKGKYYYEYEIIEILFDIYDYYKLGDKIKVYQNICFEGLEENDDYSDRIFLNMQDREHYDYSRFENSEVEKSEIPIMTDLYSTLYYHKIQGNDGYFGVYTYEELKEKYNTVVKSDRVEILLWYDYNYETLIEKIIDIKNSK